MLMLMLMLMLMQVGGRLGFAASRAVVEWLLVQSRRPGRLGAGMTVDCCASSPKCAETEDEGVDLAGSSDMLLCCCKLAWQTVTDCRASSPKCADTEDEVVDLAGSSGDEAAAAAGTQEPPSVRPSGAGSWACHKARADFARVLRPGLYALLPI